MTRRHQGGGRIPQREGPGRLRRSLQAGRREREAPGAGHGSPEGAPGTQTPPPDAAKGKADDVVDADFEMVDPDKKTKK